MNKNKEILRLLSIGMSQSDIAATLKTSRNTVRKVRNAANLVNLSWNDASRMDDDQIEQTLYPERSEKNPDIQTKPDFDVLANELPRKGVTKKLLWEEYCQSTKAAGGIPLQYSQFCNLFKSYLEKNKATMHFAHTPGERIEVDWAGTKIPITNIETGEISYGYLFVGTLPYSQYCYAEVMENMKTMNWINAHVNMFEFFGGVTPILVSDNLKTGVISHPKKGDVVLNSSYKEMGDYYDIAILPAKPLTPKGKPSVEGSVGKITTSLIAAVRNETLHSVFDANQRIQEKLSEFNARPFQKREGSRKEVFEEYEKELLKPLPKYPYEYAQHKQATVQYNYHISVDRMHYSVPYEYIKKQVDVRITKRMIEVFYKNTRIASHKRLYGAPGQYSTTSDHMPAGHRKAAEWNGDYFRKWANKIGPATYTVIDRLLKSYKAEQQAYNSCRSILKFGDSYSQQLLEETCKIALKHIHVPRYKNIKLIIRHIQQTQNKEKTKEENNDYAIVRGAEYYGGKDE